MKNIVLWLGPVIGFLISYLMETHGWDGSAQIVAGVTILCAIWWVFEPIPIPITSIIPLAIFPMTGALGKEKVAMAYGHYLILLLMGGFMISQAVEKSGIHRRIAFFMIKSFGGRGRNLVFGFMAATALLSMWISNTATTLMLLPVALAIIAQSADDGLRIALLLGICYSASVGGMGTPIGTPPNVAFIKEYKEVMGVEVSFLDWMMMGIPLVCILIPMIGLFLTRRLKSHVEVSLPEIGVWRTEEKRTLMIFSFIALAWIFRKAPFGGWSELSGLSYATDADVALLGVVLLFLVPSGNSDGSKLLEWKYAANIPWGILLLFSGGLTIASGFKEVGLSSALASQLSGFIEFHPYLLILLICFFVTSITEVTSNTASTLLLLPILAQTALNSDIIDDPKLIMIPATLSASCAFMLPVATAPNAIIYGSGKLTIKDMAREGLFLNIGLAFVISAYFYLFYS